jgi:hypothetical protein
MVKRAQIDDLDDWVGRPTLADQANADRFRRLNNEVEREIAPANIFEKLEARDISHKVAEEQLLKGMQTAIVRSARVQSLAMLLGATYGQNIDKAFKVAQDYFGGPEERQRAAQDLVQGLGISIEDIDANALHLRMASVHALDDMIDRRENGRNRLIKRHLKRRRASSPKNPASTDSKESPQIRRQRIHRARKD